MVPSVKSANKSSSLIVKSNDLINAEFGSSALELKIMCLMATQVQAGDEDFKTYFLRIQDLKEELQISSNSLNERLELIVERMIKRVIKLRDKNGNLIQFPMITRAEHQNKKGIIGLRFSPDLKPHMLNLKEKYTSYYDSNIIHLSSHYSMRIYEFLKQYEKIGTRTMSVLEIKRKLDIEDKYEQYGMFKKKVILPAQKDLQTNCDIGFVFNEIKKARKVMAIKFDIQRQRATRPMEITNYQVLINESKDLGEKLHQMGLTDQQINFYLSQKNLDTEYLKDLMNETQRRYDLGTVKNPAAYLIKLIDTGARPSKPPKKRASRMQTTLFESKPTKESQSLLDQLHHQFATIRHQNIKALIKKFSAQDWENFYRFAKKIPGNNTELFDGEQVNQDCDRFRILISTFLRDKMPDYASSFIKWAKKQGYIVTQDAELPSQFYLTPQPA